MQLNLEREGAGVSEAEASITPLHAEVLVRLRDYIAEGHLPNGARIPERALCEMFGVSRTPLREAVKVLAAEGLVDLLPNRGARVRQLRVQDVRELFDMMGGLEAIAGRLACEHITDDEVKAIEEAHHEMYGFYIRQDMAGYFGCNQKIHAMILASARNAPLTNAYASLSDRLRRVRFSANLARNRSRWAEAMREHEEMLELLRRRDAVQLADLLFQHLRNKRDAAIAYLQETGEID